MRHQAEDSAGLVVDAGDGAGRAVEVCDFDTLARRTAIAERDEAASFEPVERLGIGGIVAVVMRDRHPDRLAGLIAASEDCLVVLDAQINLAARKTQRSV